MLCDMRVKPVRWQHAGETGGRVKDRFIEDLWRDLMIAQRRIFLRLRAHVPLLAELGKFKLLQQFPIQIGRIIFRHAIAPQGMLSRCRLEQDQESNLEKYDLA